MTSAATASTRAAYRDVNVLRWTLGLFLSLLGDSIFFIALAWTATQLASPSVAGLIVAASAIPRAVLMLFGGAVSDRAGPRKSALLSDVARTVTMLAVAGVLLLEQPSIAILITLAIVFGVIDALFIPAIGAMPAVLVEPQELPRVTAMRQVAQRATSIAGAPMAGWLIASQGLSVVYSLCAGLFAVSVVALATTRTRPSSRVTGGRKSMDGSASPEDGEQGTQSGQVGGHAQTLLADVRAGLRYVSGHSLLLPLLILTAVAELGFVGAVNVGLPLLADASGWGARGVGLVLGAWGAAAALASIALTFTGSPQHAGLVGLSCLPLMGVSLAGIALAPNLLTAAAAAALLGFGSGVVGPLFGGLTLAAADTEQVGRVMSIASLASLGGAPLAYAATGVLVDYYGPNIPFLLGGVVVTVIGLLAFASQPIRAAQAARTHT